MSVTVSPADLDAHLAHDLRALLGDDPYCGVVTDRLAEGTGVGFVASWDSELAGYAHIREAAESTGNWFLDVVVPAGSEHSRHVTEALLEAARSHCRVHVLDWWTVGPHAAIVQEIADRYGFARTRTVLRFARPIDTALADVDLPWRSYDAGDAEALVEVNNRAFADHPDRSAWTTDSLAAALDDQSDLLVTPDHGPVQGFCWLKRHDDETGEIEVLAVHPRHHGCGLGRRLLRAGLQELRRRGHREALLFVEHENQAAISLYIDEGFVDQGDPLIAYEVPPA